MTGEFITVWILSSFDENCKQQSASNRYVFFPSLVPYPILISRFCFFCFVCVYVCVLFSAVKFHTATSINVRYFFSHFQNDELIWSIKVATTTTTKRSEKNDVSKCNWANHWASSALIDYCSSEATAVQQKHQKTPIRGISVVVNSKKKLNEFPLDKIVNLHTRARAHGQINSYVFSRLGARATFFLFF